MKRIPILCSIIAVLLCLVQNASAQFARKGANLVDPSMTVLTDQQIISLVGQDIYEQTVVGARKQYKTGNGLIWGGVAGLGVGAAGIAYTAVALARNNGSDFKDITSALADEPGIEAVYLGSYAAMSVGASLFTVGVILKSIGKGRLNWVNEQANAARGYTLNYGPTSHGVGVSLNF